MFDVWPGYTEVPIAGLSLCCVPALYFDVSGLVNSSGYKWRWQWKEGPQGTARSGNFLHPKGYGVYRLSSTKVDVLIEILNNARQNQYPGQAELWLADQYNLSASELLKRFTGWRKKLKPPPQLGR